LDGKEQNVFDSINHLSIALVDRICQSIPNPLYYTRQTVIVDSNRWRSSMNGAQFLIKTAIASGIEVCFTNPGTTEMPLVIAFDTVPGIRVMLGLFEGVCAGAADGYGRMLGRPAMTLVHLGPGFANAVSNLHNARRARSSVFNVIGDHSTWHRPVDPPLNMDIEGLAATVSAWHRGVRSFETLLRDVREGISASLGGRIATLIVPDDLQLHEYDAEVSAVSAPPPRRIDENVIKDARRLLQNSSPAALMLGGRALSRQGLAACARIKAATGCDLLTETFPTCWDRGAGSPAVKRTPYQAGQATMVHKYKGVVLVGTEEPVMFVGHRDFDSKILKKEQQKVFLASPEQDSVEVLERLANALGAPSCSRLPAGLIVELERPGLPKGRLTVEKACQTIAALQPEGAIIVDEGITSSAAYFPPSESAAPHTLLTISGGSLGWGMPCSIGAAVACPDRPVIDYQADGSGMYTVQSLWTQAREALNITTLVLSNRRYNALQSYLVRAGISAPGPIAAALTELDRPAIDWVRITRGMGVPAVSVETAEALARELRIALAEPGPHLIEMVL
jgi:acetolactate synthase I/II/III large subunit